MFADETYITYDDIEELPSGSLGAIRLAVLLGCYTWDFADLFVSKGARVVVGFEGTINQVAARFWNGRFWEFLTKEGIKTLLSPLKKPPIELQPILVLKCGIFLIFLNYLPFLPIGLPLIGIILV